MEQGFALYQALKELWRQPDCRVKLIEKAMERKDAPRVLYEAIGWFSIDEPEKWISGEYKDYQVERAFDVIQSTLNTSMPTVMYERAVLRRLLDDFEYNQREKAQIISLIVDMCVTGEVFGEMNRETIVN